MRHHNQELHAVTNHGKNTVVLSDSQASTPYHPNFDLAGVLPTPCTGNGGSALGPSLPLLVSPEQLAESWDDSFARGAWWRELHTSHDLHAGTTFSDLNDAVEAVQPVKCIQVSDRCSKCYFIGVPCAGPGVCGCSCHKAIAEPETSTPIQRGPFPCPINSAECDYPSCVIAGSPFATDSCIARQMETKAAVSDYLEAL